VPCLFFFHLSHLYLMFPAPPVPRPLDGLLGLGCALGLLGLDGLDGLPPLISLMFFCTMFLNACQLPHALILCGQSLRLQSQCCRSLSTPQPYWISTCATYSAAFFSA